MSSRRPRQKQRRRSLADLLQDSKLNPPAPREKRYQSRPPIATSPAAPTASKSSTTTRLPVLKTTDRKPQREPGIFPKKKGALNKSTMKKKVLFNEAPQPPVNQCAPPMDKKRLYELEKKLGSLEKEISRAKREDLVIEAQQEEEYSNAVRSLASRQATRRLELLSVESAFTHSGKKASSIWGSRPSTGVTDHDQSIFGSRPSTRATMSTMGAIWREDLPLEDEVQVRGSLLESHCKTLHTTGIVSVDSLFAPETIRVARAATEALRARCHPNMDSLTIMNPHQVGERWVWAIASHPVLVNAVQDALKPWCAEGVPGGVALSTSRLCVVPAADAETKAAERKKKNKANLWGEVDGWYGGDDISTLKSAPGEPQWYQDPELPEGSIVMWIGLDEAEYGEGLRLLPHFSQLGKVEPVKGQALPSTKPVVCSVGVGDLLLSHPRVPYQFTVNTSNQTRSFLMLHYVLLRDVPVKPEFHAHPISGQMVQRIYYKLRETKDTTVPPRDPDSEVPLEERPTFTELDAPTCEGAGLGLISSPMTPRRVPQQPPSPGRDFEHEWNQVAEQPSNRAQTAPQMPTGGYRFMISAV